MNKNVRVSLIIVAVLLGATALIWVGFTFGRMRAWGMDGFYPGGMMGYSNQDAHYGMMNGNGMMGGYYMMGGFGNLKHGYVRWFISN